MKRKKIKYPWKEYFNFSARERRGAFFLACILIIQIAFLFYQSKIVKPLMPPDSKIITSLIESIDTSVSENIFSGNSKKLSPEKITYFNFDPNTLSESSWLKLGLSEKQIRVIKNYLSKGGKFRIKNDFKRMYCISSEEYDDLKPYLLLPDSIKIHFQEREVRKFKKEIVDIQDADTTELMKLMGIGSIYANRIVRYREKLGGFYSIDQIKEVWGITDTIFDSIIPFIVLKNKLPYRFIHLNTDTFATLASHPYIKGKVASLLCSYRNQHKSFTTLDELKQLPLISEENFLKLAPYLLLD